MFYTDEMKRAVKSIERPKNFGVDIAEHGENGILYYMEIIMDEKLLMSLSHDDKIAAVQYTMKVRDALESNGAIVQVTRRAIE
jgi:hypothetical protein